MCLARLLRLIDLRTRYTHVFSAFASGRSTSWAKLVMGETRGLPSPVGTRVCRAHLTPFKVSHMPLKQRLFTKYKINPMKKAIAFRCA